MGKCIGCGKQTGRRGDPFTICENCTMVIENWSKAREQMRKMHRNRFGIRELEFTGDDDTSYNLSSLASRLANIEEEIAWMKNILSNMRV